MKIVDEKGQELTNPDLTLGWLKQEKKFIKTHKEIPAREEKWHYELIKTYPNGGQDFKKVIDVEEQLGIPQWDEYEYYNVYVPYTEQELENIRNKPEMTLEERIKKCEEELNLLTQQAEEG